jgi:hypothetical protein
MVGNPYLGITSRLPVTQELGRANGHGGDWRAAISLLRSRISGPTLDGGMS